MPKYQIEVPGKGTFEVESPTDLTDAQAYAAVRSQIQSMPTGKAPSSLKDTGIALAQGIVGAGKSLTDVAGADNVASEYLAGVQKGLGAAYSPKRQAEMARRAQLQEEASQSGSLYNEINTFLGGVAEAPIQSLAQALGSIVPYVGTGVIGGVAKLGAPTIRAINTVVGAAQGAGAVKGSIYDGVKDELIKSGMSESEAKSKASKAQEYLGENFLSIAGGSALGAAGARLGVEELMLPGAAAKLNAKLLPRVTTAALGEAPLEGVQGGQEQLATNLALQKQGFGVDATKGVVGSAARDALLGALAAGTVGLKGPGAQPPAAIPAVTPPFAEPEAQVVPPTGITPPQPTLPGAPVQASFLEAGPTPPAPPTAEAADPELLGRLRQQYDVLEREIDRLAQQFEAEQDPAKKLAIKVQAQKYDYARQEIAGQLQGAEARPGTAPVEGQAELDFTQPEPQVDLSYYQPKTALQAEPTIIGEKKATPDQQAIELEFAKQRLQAGAPLTPAQQLLLRQDKAPETAAPQLELPMEVGAGARPTSFVVDDKAINTFGLSKAATKLRSQLRGLDLMKEDERAKFEDAIAKHERKNAKIDMQAVEDFKAAIPQPVPAREVPEAAGLPAREYTPRQQYQQAREAMFAFGQQAAPISPKDRALLAKQQFEAKNGTPIPDAGTRTSEPSVQLPSGEQQPAAGTTAPTTAGLASPVATTGRTTAGEGRTGKAQPAPLSPFAQMAQQLAPEGKPDLKAEKKAKKKLGFGEVEKPAPTRKGTAYRTTAPNMDGMSVKDVQGVVNRIIDGWKNSPLIQVVQFENQLPQAVQDQIKRDGVIRPQGLWDEDTQAVYLIADNLVSPKDVGLTVAHEALGHYGLRTILGENYSKVMNQMYQNAEVKTRADNKIARGMDKEIAVEEVLAEMAEQQVPPTVIQKLINILRQLMAKAGFPMKGVTNGEIKALLEQSRQYVIEGKGEAGKGGMKVGKVFSGDAPIFYSKLAAMAQHAPKNLRDGASGKAWADWINSNAGKFGVKKEEIEWSGIDDLLALMDKQFKFTSKDVNDMLKEEGVKVEEVFYGVTDPAKDKELRKEESRLNNKAFDLAEEMLDKNVFTVGTWYHKQASEYAADKAKPDAQLGDYLENIHVPILENTFQSYYLKPELADEYNDKIKSIQDEIAELHKKQGEVYGRGTRFDPYKTHGGENYTEIVLTLPTATQYNHPHWPGVDNPIAHTRFSEFTDADGKRVLLVDEVQSDWGQESKEKGFGEPASVEEYGAAVNMRSQLEIAYAQAVRKLNAENGTNYSESVYRREDAPEELQDLAASVANAQERAREMLESTNRVPQAPFVQDTKVWSALVVKRLLRYAADNGISRIAFIDGQTAHERFPTSVGSGSTEKGMKTFYDQILPSVTKDVLRKLGADSKPVRSDIEVSQRPGYSVYVNGELVDGPYDNEGDAWVAGADIAASGEVDSDAIKIKSADGPVYKSFMAFDIAPETAERVKEGQAMFRSAGTAAGQQAEQLMDAFGGRQAAGPTSYVQQKQDSFNKAKDAWQESYERNQSRVAATFGKSQNIASFDQAFNNRLYNHFMDLVKKGDKTLEQAKQALIRISISQALHRGNLANQIIDRGNYDYDATTNRWTALEDPVNMKAFEGLIRSLADKLGVEPNRARQIMGAAYEANRLKDMYVQLNKTTADLAQAEADLKTIKDPKQRATKKSLIQALEDKQEELNKKVQHKTPEQVAAGMELYNAYPEIAEGTQVWNTMRERVVKLLVDTGVKTQEQAEKWLEEAAYVPFFRDISEEKAAGPQVMARGIRESMKDFRMKGSQLEVHDPIENMYQWMQWSIARGISNKQLQVMLDQYKSVLPDEVAEGKGDAGNTFSVYRDGVMREYHVADPAIAQAFTGMEPIVFPGIGMAVGVTNNLRHLITRNPLFSAAQLFSDSYTAMFTSGLKHPFALLKEIAKEVSATARGTSTTREALKAAGILETHDYSAMNEADALGQRLNLNEPSKWRKTMSTLDRLSSASDNVIRQGIYNQAIKEGLSHAEAMEKAAEIVNFRRISGDPRIQFLSRIVPFFNAYMQVTSVAIKTLTGRGISPQERMAAEKVLLATTAKVAMLSLLYSMAIGDDEDYLKKNRVSRDRMWMIPGTGGMGIPVRADIFVLPKIASEYTYQMMSDKGTTDSKMFKDAIKRSMLSLISPPSEGIPQIVRPVIEIATNHDFFQDREIVNATMRRLDADKQYNKNTTEFSKALGSMTGMSPLMLDHFFRGYFGSAVTVGALATNDLINAARGNPPRPDMSVGQMLGSLPNMSGFMSKEENTAVLTDFYEVARDVNKAVATFSSMKYAPREERQAYMEEHNKELRLKGSVQALSNQLLKLKQHEQAVREMPESRMSAERKQAELKRIDEARSKMTANIAKIRRTIYD